MIDNCPHCNANLVGDLIFDTFMKKYGDEAKALETAKMYGASKTEGHWRLEIAIYDFTKDRTVAYRCPACEKEWDR